MAWNLGMTDEAGDEATMVWIKTVGLLENAVKDKAKNVETRETCLALVNNPSPQTLHPKFRVTALQILSKVTSLSDALQYLNSALEICNENLSPETAVFVQEVMEPEKKQTEKMIATVERELEWKKELDELLLKGRVTDEEMGKEREVSKDSGS